MLSAAAVPRKPRCVLEFLISPLLVLQQARCWHAAPGLGCGADRVFGVLRVETPRGREKWKWIDRCWKRNGPTKPSRPPGAREHTPASNAAVRVDRNQLSATYNAAFQPAKRISDATGIRRAASSQGYDHL